METLPMLKAWPQRCGFSVCPFSTPQAEDEGGKEREPAAGPGEESSERLAASLGEAAAMKVSVSAGFATKLLAAFGGVSVSPCFCCSWP